MELEISKSVLTDIAASALERIEGLELAAASSRPGTLGNLSVRDLKDLNVSNLNMSELAQARRPRALKITREGNTVTLEVGVNIEYGRNLVALGQQAGRALQENIELMTGLKVGAVNVIVQSLTLPPQLAAAPSAAPASQSSVGQP